MVSPKGPDQLAESFYPHQLSISSRAVHADDYINNHRAVAPPLHLSTTFRYSDDPDALRPWDNRDENAPFDSHVYSRDTAPNTNRLEALLTNLLGQPSLTYASGMAAFHAMIVFLNPRRVAIGHGYHGCHGTLAILKKLNGLEKLELESDSDLAKLQAGDVIHVETPLNPTGEARDLEFYAKLAQEKKCYLTVDATFAPPPLLDPFLWGADIAMHSGSKYVGGHTDMLCGILAVNRKHVDISPENASDPAKNWITGLREERLTIGGVMGSLEGWLGVRSLRTIELRVERQTKSAAKLVDWLADEKKNPDSPVSQVIERIHHASQQPEAADPSSWLRRQMPNGFGPVFSIILKEESFARRLPSKLALFHHATSLGGVESLIEWRAMTDRTIDKRLLRVSVGVEGWEDLQEDLLRAFKELLAEKK
ncbi:cystathionine gamma-synthase [Ophiostoma piceae UAMH 11346]|uniref:Cystathionine gamma-synthase n=1 Tax=Ophiostoma piceae (strain UAMH 11346) TaxID=1262450 RepID=S3D0I4_OPHP1|nr:cystathionine gamma-synthase [Ophiostoma piceae UAMH 11346]